MLRREGSSTCSAARCAKRGSSRRPGFTRSTTTSPGSPRNAQRLAEGFFDGGVPVDLEQVESNFVFLYPERLGLSREEAAANLRAEGILVSNAAPRGVLRAVTHLDVSASDVDRAVERARAAFALQRSPAK